MHQKPPALFQQYQQLQQGLKEGHTLAFKAHVGFESISTDKIRQLSKDYELGFPVICDRILQFLKQHHSFDAGLLQRWVEQRAHRLERMERRFFHRLISLFGRGKVMTESAAQLQMLAKMIEGQRQGFDQSIVNELRRIPQKLITSTEGEREKLFHFIEHHHKLYLKELLDLRDLLDTSTFPQTQAFSARLHLLLDRQEKDLVDALFEGSAIEVIES